MKTKLLIIVLFFFTCSSMLSAQITIRVISLLEGDESQEIDNITLGEKTKSLIIGLAVPKGYVDFIINEKSAIKYKIMSCYGDLYGTSYQYTISGNLSVDQSMIYILKTNSNGISLVPFEPGSQNSSNSIYNLPSQSINTNTQNDSKYKCGYCNGTGKCPYCNSAGQSKACVENQFGVRCTDSYCIAHNHKCKHCEGTHICSRCKGNGYK